MEEAKQKAKAEAPAEPPKPAEFAHLHLHTHYSMLDGACTATGLVKLMKQYGMTACAITDHGYVGGAEEFHRVLSGSGLNPVVGVEAYVSPTTRFDKNPSVDFIKGHHLVLLCENDVGYHNLCKLVSSSYREGLYYKPRMDKELLRQYHEGIIALSACIAGEIPHLLLQGNRKAAEKALDEYVEIFGKDNFFIELMDHQLEEEKQVIPQLVELARSRGVGLVATNDCHYMRKEDAEAHDIMLCIQTGALRSDAKRFRFPNHEFYFKSVEEMKELFKQYPDAIANTVKIADRCSIKFEYGANHYPVFHMPDGSEPTIDTLREICFDNMMMRYDFDPRACNGVYTPEQQKVIDRMEFELKIIGRTGFCSYFMVVADFITYGKKIGVPIGPGRGSGAGSIVAYLMQITDIDPLRYNLLFERFLNPERVSPPDFDIDFCEKRRGEVIEYVRGKYGFDSVAQICTYGQLKAKAVVKDVARVLGFSFDEGNKLTKMIPNDLKITIDEAIEKSKELADLIESDERVKELFKYAKVLEGLNRQTGVHAAGVIIGDQRLDNLVPLSRSATGDMVVQYPKEPCEKLGLLKMDFLGLRTLTIIRNALDMIEQQHGVKINLSKLPLDDKKTFEMLQRGEGTAVFQLESGGMQNTCRRLGVETIEHIIALVALYRPGPMDYIPTFIARKKGLEEVKYLHPKMEPILKETYGIMVYQEQIMQVVQALAGYSLGGADILRRAIGKKKLEVMAAQHETFINGCASCNNIPKEVAEQIWSDIKTFANYGFNKSHSAAYGIVSYQTAYLKANYPVEFMAAVMTGELANADKLKYFISVATEMGIKVLPPDVNSSGINFSVDHGCIRFGLGAIKGFGEVAAATIMESRAKDGEFKNFLDFCERCGGSINSRMMEHLVRSGALDSMKLRRSQLLAISEPMLAFAAERAKDKAQGQGSLFDMLDGGDAMDESISVPVPDIPEISRDEILADEKELLGFFVSGHPLSPFSRVLHTYATRIYELTQPVDDEEAANSNEPPKDSYVRVAGMIDSVTVKFSKTSKKKFAIMTLEDMGATCECMVYERVLSELEKSGLAKPGTQVYAELTVSRRSAEEAPRLVVEKCYPLSALPAQCTEEFFLHIREENYSSEVTEQIFTKLKSLIPASKKRGDTDGAPDLSRAAKLVICALQKNNEVDFIELPFTAVITMEFIQFAESLLGEDCWRAKIIEPTAPRRWKGDLNRENKDKKEKAAE